MKKSGVNLEVIINTPSGELLLIEFSQMEALFIQKYTKSKQTLTRQNGVREKVKP
jgi:hypothetical protein